MALQQIFRPRRRASLRRFRQRLAMIDMRSLNDRRLIGQNCTHHHVANEINDDS
jgi:hypothetical protein